jgi:hypothetical protein
MEMLSIPEQSSFQIVGRLMFNSNKLTDTEQIALREVFQLACDRDTLFAENVRLEQVLINFGLAEEVGE